MQKRKTIVVDKTFQHKVTFSLVGIVIFIVALIIGIIGFNAVDNNTKIDKIVKKMEDIIISQEHHIEALKNISKIKNANDVDIASGVLSKNLLENIELLDNNVMILNRIVRNTTLLIIVMIIVVLFQGILLYYFLIRQTNRIAGPIFVITQYMKDIISGEYPEIRPLRDNDEFKDMYDVFGQMVERLKIKKN